MAFLEQDPELAPLAGPERRRRPLRESLTLPVLLASVAFNAGGPNRSEFPKCF
jgi:hypothetical protein